METNEISPFCTFLFLALAVIHTGFYTFCAFKIHEITPRKNTPWVIHQRWFNLLGASTSWLILWSLLPCLIQSFSAQSMDCLSLKEIILFLISLIGLSGYLPFLLFGIARSANEAANKIAKL